MALAHAVGSKVEPGDLVAKRRRSMDAWADYCAMVRPSA
jgi:hypothetical protein